MPTFIPHGPPARPSNREKYRHFRRKPHTPRALAPGLISGSGSGASATLSYDPLGRLQKTVIHDTETNFLYDGDALIAAYDITGTLLRRYVHGSRVDSPLIWYDGSAADDAPFVTGEGHAESGMGIDPGAGLFFHRIKHER